MTPVQVPPKLRTVTGGIPVTAIEGPVLAHEHLQIDLRWPVRIESDPRRWLDEETRVSAELTGLRTGHGLSLVVDLTGLGAGRNAATLSRISAGSRVAVVAATGLLAEPFHPEFVRDASAEVIAQRLLAEIGFGMDGTSTLPGVIGEVGSWDGMPSEQEERCLRGCAAASLESGLSVATHSPFAQAALAHLEVLLGAGLPAGRIAVGGQDLVRDAGVHRKLAESGAYVSFGSLARTGNAALRPVLELIDAGHAGRILLSSGLSRMSQLASYGGPGLGYLFDEFAPALLAAGVAGETLRGILHDNPLRWLTAGAA